MHKSHLRFSFFLFALVTLACAGEKKEPPESEGAKQPETSAGAPAPAATGDTILIEAWSEADGNYFKPNKIEAHQGDVLRYVLKSGVHNVHFLPDSNEIKTGLPPASDMLQLPGQTYDLVVTMRPGHYYFQCDPHAALGMKGRLEVEEED